MEEQDKNKLFAALNEVLRRDGFLITNKAWETCVSAKLMAYLQELYAGEYDVDHEYDRLFLANKGITDLDKTERPDVIIHRRNTAKNHIAIEIKVKDRDYDDDLKKLLVLTDVNGIFKYTHGLFIRFGSKPDGSAAILDIELINQHNGNVGFDSFLNETANFKTYLKEKGLNVGY